MTSGTSTPARSLSHTFDNWTVKMLQQDEVKVVADSTTKNLTTTSEIPVSIVERIKGSSCGQCRKEPPTIASLSTQNLNFVLERLFDGCLDDLLSLIRIAWNNYNIAQLITIVEQTTRSREAKEGPTQ